jgi:hypothetical protein
VECTDKSAKGDSDSFGQASRKTYPIGFMEAARRGRPLVLYRTDNEVSTNRAERLCQAGNERDEDMGLPWSCLPPKPEPQQQTGWWRPTATLGGVAAAYKYLLQQGQEPTAEALTEFFKGISFHEGPVEMILYDLQRNGHSDKIRAEVNGSMELGTKQTRSFGPLLCNRSQPRSRKNLS